MALSTVCGDDDIVTPITQVDELARIRAGGRAAQHYSSDRALEEAYAAGLAKMTPEELAAATPPVGTFVNHMSLTAVYDLLGAIPRGTMVFGVERCPYEKVISYANMLLKFDAYRASGEAMRSNVDELKAAIAHLVDAGQAPLVRNIDRYRDPQGALTTRILRYDDLAEEFGQLLADLGLPLLSLPHAKKGLFSARFDPRKLFAPQHLARVNAEFADEFDAFGWPRVEPAP